MKEGWRNKRIDEITNLITDGDWIESRHQSEDGFRLIQTGNIGCGIFKSKDDKPHYISETTFKELGCTEIFEGDCLISRLPDPVGRSCLIPNIGNRMITAVDCTILRFKKEIIPSFFVYYTQSNRYSKEIEGNVTGATRKRISRKNLEKIQVPVPPLSEQQHIVEELDLLSSIIEKKKTQLHELDNMAQSLFYEMFGDPIINDKGWKVIRLGDKCQVSSFKRVLIEDVVDKGIPFIRGTELMTLSNGDDVNFTLFITPEHYEVVKEISGVPIIGDLLIPSINAKGNIWIVNTEQPRYYKDGRVLWVHVDSESYTSETLKYIMSLLIKKTYSVVASGATFAELKLFVLRDLRTIIPPISIQQRFSEGIKDIERQKGLVKQSIKEVETLFNSRMDYYFN